MTVLELTRVGITLGSKLAKLCLAILVCFGFVVPAARAIEDRPDSAIIAPLVPSLQAHIQQGMETFDCPGLAIRILADDRLVYSKGFGVRDRSAAFLAATIALMVDRGKLRWDDRIVDLYPEFQLQDPWVTREFRVFDLLAQRSGLPPEVNDGLGMFGYSESDLIRSLRYVAPVSSFRSTFSYPTLRT
jgi:CubicO group peptidase (beta-lactamase class C family)